MYDQLREESPMIQEMREQYLIKGGQHSLVTIVRARFPDLDKFAEKQASHFDKLEILDWLIQQIAIASDTNTARRLLEGKEGPSETQ